MENKKVVQIVFSPTGSTKKVADTICSEIYANYRMLDLSINIMKTNFAKDNILVAAVPVFGGRVPQTAKDRLLRIHAEGSQAIAIVVYGNRAYDDALLELSDILTDIGCNVIAAAAFIGEHSMLKEIATGRPDSNDLNKAREFATQVVQKLDRGDFADIHVPGNPKYKKKKASGGMMPKTNRNCISCGKCSETCPVGAIPFNAPKKTYKNCIGCMRCVYVCPQNARTLPTTVQMLVKTALSSAKKKRNEPEIYC
jgi:ferredoxin